MLRKQQILLPAITGLGAASVALAFMLSFDEPWALRGDNKLIHFPMQLEAYRLWLDGRVPFWTDSIWMGYPLLANSETSALYLPRFIGFWLTPAPHLRAFDIGIALHAGLLVAGSVALLRRLGCARPAALFGAGLTLAAPQAIGLTSYVASFSCLAWWPWLFLAADHLGSTRERPLRAVVLASLPLGLQVLAGYPEMALYSGCLAGVWVLAAPGEIGSSARLLRAVSLATLGVLLAGPQLLPTLGVLLDTRRGLEEGARGLLAVAGTPLAVVDPTDVSLLSPFLGAATLALAVMAVVRRAPRSVDLAVVGVVAALIAFGDATPVYEWVSRAPLFELFRGPHKFFLISQLSVVWLAALGLQQLLGDRPWRSGGAASGLRVAIAGLFTVGAVAEYAWASSSLLARVSDAHTPTEVPLSLGLEELRSLSPVLTRRELKPGPPPRVFTGVNTLRMGSLPSVVGAEIVRGGGVSLLSFRHLWLVHEALGPRHMDLLGVQLVLARPKCQTRANLRYRVVERSSSGCVLRNPRAPLRYELLPGHRRVDTMTELVNLARREPGGPVGIQAGSDAALPPETGNVPGSVEVLSVLAGEVELEVTTEAAQLLLVRQSWARGWRALVDGRAAPIYPAAGVFFAVPVPAGRHRVALSFRAPGFAAGLALGGSWLLLAGLAFAPDVRARARAAR